MCSFPTSIHNLFSSQQNHIIRGFLSLLHYLDVGWPPLTLKKVVHAPLPANNKAATRVWIAIKGGPLTPCGLFKQSDTMTSAWLYKSNKPQPPRPSPKNRPERVRIELQYKMVHWSPWLGLNVWLFLCCHAETTSWEHRDRSHTPMMTQLAGSPCLFTLSALTHKSGMFFFSTFFIFQSHALCWTKLLSIEKLALVLQ